nr:Pleiotropic drug resistance protein 1 [Ipomoea batatas]
MEPADLGILRGGSLRASLGGSMRGSLRANSNSIWRSTGAEVFSRSSRDEDDEEALKWAALEKLPTFDRLRKGLIFGPDGPAAEIDINNLGYQERMALLDRLVKVADEDNEKFLSKLKNRIDRVGIDMPTIEVRYEHLNIEATAYVGSRALPTFINAFTNIFEDLLTSLHITKSKARKLTILNDVSGIVKPCRMTLLLGPPGSGKTTLLLAMAGKLDKDLKVSGNVTYNGHKMNEFVPQRTASYISQHDLHIGEMTVRETLEFSARCQGVGSRYEMLAELSRREKAANIKPDPDLDVFMKAAATEGQEANVVTDYILKILGLDICADTMVGDQMLRGISGGQKKRVTTGEMIVGPAKALFMDEISTGLDSSTTYSIVNSLRQYVHILKGTAVISLLQPAPETYNLFDDIILLSDGYVVYNGPRELVVDFFESMGFRCPDRKGVADFLQEVTSKKDQQQYWVRRDEPYRFITSKEFAEAYQSFHVGRKLAEELSVPFDKTKSHPAALTKEKFGIGKRELLKVCTEREYLLMKRNSFAYYFKFFQLVIIALITMTLFFRTKLNKDDSINGGIYSGALFFGVIMIMFNGMSEVPMTIYKLPVFYKQRDLLFFPSWAYALPSWILKVPITLVEVGLWVFITYYVIGFDPNIGRLFKQYLLLIMVNQMASGLFRFISSVGRTMGVAMTFGAFSVLLQVALGGFVLARNDVKKWWIWMYWSSPLMYSQNAIMVNEFKGHSWRKVFNTTTGEILGDAVVESRGYFAESKWYWIGFGALIGFTVVFNISYALGLHFLNQTIISAAYGKPQATLPDDDENENDAGRQGGENATSEGAEPKQKGMVLPFEPHSLTFDNVVYSVDMPVEMKEQGATEDRLVLLKGVSGAFRPGVLTALMGVSGAGKTTLMDVLAGRKTGGYIDGDIKISGYPKKQDTFARISGYCEQNDIHSPYVTVHESLVYSAWLRLPDSVDAKTRMMFVNEVMELVELTPLKSALVGLPGVNGLSTEQRKRLTIAVELVANPSIIFMDEPTSGLDARAAAIVMRTVRNTVDTGRTVVCTIHQPSIDIFEAFDELFLMKRGGQEIYVGPLGRQSCHLIKYFESINGVAKIKDGYNPATWMLEVTASSQELALGVDFTDLYKNSDLCKRNKSLITELSTPRPGTKDLYFPTKFSQSFFSQCLACFWKQRLSYWRNPAYTAVRFFFTTFIALTFGTIFWKLGKKTEKRQDLINAMGSMYAAVLFLGVQNSASVQPVVSVERTVFYREKAAGMFSALPYAFAQVAIEIPYVFAQSAVYGLIVYAMIGFEWDAGKFFWYLFVMYMTLLYFTFYGMMSVAITPNENVASIVSAFFYGIWNVFSGFMIQRPRMPIWWRWYFWACPVSWTLYGLVASQFGDLETQVTDANQSVKELLDDFLGFKHSFLGVVAAVLVVFPVMFAVTFAYAIKVLNFQKR